MASNVVIAGGGFGGLYAARRLERKLPRESARITLVSDENFLLYTPLLPGAAAGSLEPRHVVVPLREELRSTHIRLARVIGADPDLDQVYIETAEGRTETLDYDQLVVALGSVSRVLPIPGLAEHGIGFKTLSEAAALRNRAIQHLETAEGIEDRDERREWLTFVFVGGGYAGLEGIAELQDYVADTVERYPRCRLDGTRWMLVEAADRVMQEIPAGLARFATEQLRARGLEIRTQTQIEEVTERGVRLSGGEEIATRCLCWTAGVKPPRVVHELGLPLTDADRIETDDELRVRGRENVWAIGDAAAVPDPAKKDGSPCPPTAQHALRQGRLAGDNVAATLAGRPTRRFRYRTLGVFVDMGQHKAVATMLGVPLRGFPAWFAARTYHLAAMPGLARRLRLMTDWTVGLFFGRASAGLGQLGHPPSLGGYLPEDRDRPGREL
ncbi:MAG: NAD(P)/FAD-dependent oxidoreductase [Actinomycetota bacterium]